MRIYCFYDLPVFVILFYIWINFSYKDFFLFSLVFLVAFITLGGTFVKRQHYAFGLASCMLHT